MQFRTITAMLFSLIFSGLCAQEVQNDRIETNEEHLIVYYDLIGEPEKVYTVSIQFLGEDGTILPAVSLNGDLGKVQAGKGKTIVWDIYKDLNGLEGTISTKFDVEVMEYKTSDVVLPAPKPKPPSKVVDVVDETKKKQKNWRTGLKVGLGRSRVNTNQRSLFYKGKFAPEIGFYTRYYPTKRFHLQPELVYRQQNFEELLSDSEKLIHRHHVLRGQLVAGVAPIGGGLHFNFGAYYGYRLSGDSFSEVELQSAIHDIADVNSANLDRLPFDNHDVGYILGGSWSFFRGGFVMGFQFSGSFESFVTGNYELLSEQIIDQQLRNRSAQFYIQKAF